MGDEQRDEPDLTDEEIAEGEEIAIPAGDITGAITDSMDEVLEHRDEDEPNDSDSDKR
jgi:hypothetical protein